MTEEIRCPECGGATTLRKSKKGSNAGKQFHVCADYPWCKGKCLSNKRKTIFGNTIIIPGAKLPPLIEPPKGGELIVLDEEEQRKVDDRLASFFGQPEMTNVVYPEDIRKPLENMLVSEELVELAQKRIEEGELQQAASSCIKALSLYPQNIDAWITFAQAHLDYGDYARAKSFLRGAIKAMDDQGLRRGANPWHQKIVEVQRQINHAKSHGKEGNWPEFQGRLIVAIFWLGCFGAATGALWACALGKSAGFGALCGGTGSAVFALIMSPTYARNRQSSAGFALLFGSTFYIVVSIIGLIVWLIRWLA
jgi:ssDNA-binding Zn-finger/Zn-ribbon topoisomerase 1